MTVLLGILVASLAVSLYALLRQHAKLQRAKRDARRFESLVSVADDIIWMCDLQGRFTFVSPGAERQSGFTIEEIMQSALPYVVRDGVHREQVVAILQAVRDTGSLPVTRLEVLQNCKDGSSLWTDVSIGVLRDEAGRARELVGINRDVTRQRQLRDALASRAAAIEEAAEAISIRDHEGKLEYVNPAYERLTGYASSEIIGKNFRLLDDPEDMAAFYAEVTPVIKRGDIWRGELRNRDRSGRSYFMEASVAPVRDEFGQMRQMVSVIRDVTEAKRMAAELEQRAHFDQLTGLPNRSLFFDRLEDRILQAQRQQLSLALLFIDLDDFKTINDEQGHAAGDIALLQVAQRMRAAVRSSDTLARIGGDEFALLVGPVPAPIDVNQVASKLLAAIESPLQILNSTYRLSASVGIALYPEQASDADALLQHADTAMYRAKREGKNSFRHAEY